MTGQVKLQQKKMSLHSGRDGNQFTDGEYNGADRRLKLRSLLQMMVICKTVGYRDGKAHHLTIPSFLGYTVSWGIRQKCSWFYIIFQALR